MNLLQQLEFYERRDIDQLKAFFYDSEHIGDYDFTSALENIYEFIIDICESKYIDKENQILEYKLVQEELLGTPSIRLSLSNKDTFEIEYIIKLNVNNRFKDKYCFENLRKNIIYSTNDIYELKSFILK